MTRRISGNAGELSGYAMACLEEIVNRMRHLEDVDAAAGRHLVGGRLDAVHGSRATLRLNLVDENGQAREIAVEVGKETGLEDANGHLISPSAVATVITSNLTEPG